MSDPDSLRSEVKKLISIRMAHPALQSRGDIRFAYYGKESYPLAYVRTSGDEKILVVLNPSDKKTEFSFDGEAAEVIYSFGGEAELSGGKVTAQPVSACFIKLK